MDFFTYQDRSRRKTKGLIFLFFVAVALIIVTVYGSVFYCQIFLNRNFAHQAFEQGFAALNWWQPQLFGWTAAIVGLIIGGGCLIMIQRLSNGGESVALMLGGRWVDPNSKDLDERKLLNVVEEMSIASGIPVPKVYILDNEAGINAFAAGFSVSDAAIGVTKGAVSELKRDELQGVIGHEFSHILNGDMRLNIRLTGALHGILCIALIGRGILRVLGRSRSSGSRRGGGIAVVGLFGLALCLIGYIGLFFGKLIKSAVSRSREFLADASSVQFTRNPVGLADALKKIASHASESHLHTTHAETISHMFFCNAVDSIFFTFSWMATHPPLNERLTRLDPAAIADLVASKGGVSFAGNLENEVAGISFLAGSPSSVSSAELTAQVGKLVPKQVLIARKWLSSLDPKIAGSVHDTTSGRALIYAMLLDHQEPIRTTQLNSIKKCEVPLMQQELTALEKPVAALTGSARLSLIDLTVPALRRLKPNEYQTFRQVVKELIHADGKFKLSEFVLSTLLERHLRPTFEKVDKQNIRYRSLNAIFADCILVLSALAQAGHKDFNQASATFYKVVQRLCRTDAVMIDASRIQLRNLAASLEKLAHASPSLKRDLIETAVAMVTHDGTITPTEAELIRAIADAMACPMPMLG